MNMLQKGRFNMDLSKKIKRKIVGTFIGTGGKKKDQERTKFIECINRLTTNIDDAEKKLNFVNKSHETIINCHINDFISRIKSFRDVEANNKINIKGESYTAINGIVLERKSSISNYSNNFYEQLVAFYEIITRLLSRCKKAPDYALIGGKNVQEAILKLQKSIESLIDKICRFENKILNQSSENLKLIMENLKSEIGKLNVILEPLENIAKFKEKLKVLIENLNKKSNLLPDSLSKTFSTLSNKISNLYNKISLGKNCNEFDNAIEEIKIIFKSNAKSDIFQMYKIIINEYLSELKRQLELSKKNFDLKNKQHHFEHNIINIINDLNKTDFYNKIYNNNYKNSRNIVDINRFINDVEIANQKLLDTIKKNLPSITPTDLWQDFINILTNFKNLITNIKVTKELAVNWSLHYIQQKIILNQFPKFIKDETKDKIKLCFKNFCDSYGKLLNKINIIFEIPENSIMKDIIKKELEQLWVVDQNKTGNILNNKGNLTTNDLKELIANYKNKEFLLTKNRLHGPQNALEIADNINHMNIQVHRRSGPFSRTANYILVDNNGNMKYGDKYPGEKNNRINNNNNNESAVKEITNYLKNVLYYGRFENNKSWLEQLPIIKQ